MALKLGRQISSVRATLAGSVIPAGTISPFGGGTVPTGWLLCNGSQVDRATYANLFLAVGTAHGTGNGSTTFHLPDLRGRFIRGVDGAQGRDPDRASRTAPNAGGNTGDAVGSVQGHAHQTHTHTQNNHNHDQLAHDHTQTAHNHDIYTSQAAPAGVYPYVPSGPRNSQQWASPSSSAAPTIQTKIALNVQAIATNQNAVATGTHAQATANETRPVNVGVHYIIKY